MKTVSKLVSIFAVFSVAIAGLVLVPSTAMALEVGFNTADDSIDIGSGWSSEDDARVSDNNCADSSSVPRSFELDDFDFNLPNDATITGVQVDVEYAASPDTKTSSVQLVDDTGALVGSAKTLTSTAGSSSCNNATFVTLGGPGDMWGTSLTVADIEDSDITNSDFGVRVTSSGANGTRTIDSIRIKIFYDPAVIPTEIVSLTLVNSAGGAPESDIETIDNADIFNYDVVGTSLSIRANANPAGDFGSVVFDFDGGTVTHDHTENIDPWTAAGDDGSGDYASIFPLLSIGAHTVTVTPYSGANGTGIAGTPLTRNFTIIENENTVARCGDGIDNDQDGTKDYDNPLYDAQCQAFFPHFNLSFSVTNDDTGTAVAGDFTKTFDGMAIAFPASFEAYPETAHDVLVTGPVGYTISYSGACDATGSFGVTPMANPGTIYNCSIVANDDPVAPGMGTVTFVTNVVNDNGGLATPNDFQVVIWGTNVTPGPQQGSNAGTVFTMEAGAFTPAYAYNSLTWGTYSVSYSGDCSGTMVAGDAYVCTMTANDNPSSVTLVKQVVNDNGGSMTAIDFPLFIDGNPVNSGDANSVNAGTRVATEIGHPEYSLSFSGDCNANGEIALLPGSNKTCYLTNNDNQPTITVIKNVVGGGDKFASDFNLFIQQVDGDRLVVASFPGSEVGTVISLDPDTYEVNEVVLEGYRRSEVDCYVVLAFGDHKTCTITNTYEPNGTTFSGGGGGLVTTGQVLGATIEVPQTPPATPPAEDQGQVLGATTNGCPLPPYELFSSIKNGVGVDASLIIALQTFLNTYEGNTLALTGVYDAATRNAVIAFQRKYMSDVLGPWGLNDATGVFYLTSAAKAYEIAGCGTVTLPPLQ